MKNVFRISRIIALVAIIGFSFAACDLDNIDGDEVTLSRIEVTTMPTKTRYNIGDTLDKTGMVVTATYSDGSTEKVTSYTTSSLDSASAGEKIITVSYKNKTTTFKVTVVAGGTSGTKVPTPTANPASGTAVAIGQTITLTCSEQGTEIWYTTNNSAPAKNGNGSTKYTAAIPITALPTTIKAIAVKDNWTDSDVLTAEYTAANITAVDITITAPTNGGTPAQAVTSNEQSYTAGTVTWSPDDSPFKAETEYTATVTLTATTGRTFTGITNGNVKVDGNAATSVSVTNNGTTLSLTYKFPATGAKTVTDIAIKTQPTTLTYTHGEALNLTGLVVTLTNNDATTEDVTAANFSSKGVTANPAHSATLNYATHNGHPVTITYGNLPSVSTDNLTVNQVNASTFTIEPTPITAQTYSSSPITPQITVKDGGKTLTLITDYTVAYTIGVNLK